VEEEIIVETMLSFAARGYNLEREDLYDCVEIICSSMPIERQKQLPFKNTSVAPLVLKRGFLDTSEGLVLTGKEALEAVRVKEASDNKKRVEK